MEKKTYVHQLTAATANGRKVVYAAGSIFQKKDDAANHDPVVKTTQNGKKFFVLHGTYNRKAAAYAFGDENIAAADEEGNIKAYINVMVDDALENDLKQSRAWAGDSVQLLGVALTGKAQEGKMPSLWITGARLFNVRSVRAGGSDEKLTKNSTSVTVHNKDDNTDVTVSVISGTITAGYNSTPAITVAKTKSEKPYCRFQVKAGLSQHALAEAFQADDTEGGVMDKYIRCSAFGFTYDRAMKLNLAEGDTIVLMGVTSTNVYNGKTSYQMMVDRILRHHGDPDKAAAQAKPAAAPAAPAHAAPAAKTVAPAELDAVEDTISDDDDLPF